jgi:hypothetical protein
MTTDARRKEFDRRHAGALTGSSNAADGLAPQDRKGQGLPETPRLARS